MQENWKEDLGLDLSKTFHALYASKASSMVSIHPHTLVSSVWTSCCVVIDMLAAYSAVSSSSWAGMGDSIGADME